MAHGIRTKEINTGPVPVAEIPSAVVALVGIAPKGPINSLVNTTSEAADTQFGSEVPGFDIPSALATLRKEGAKDVLVVNVFDPATMTTPVAAETVAMTAGKGKTAFAPISGIVVTHTTGTPIYDRGVDFEIDDFGNIRSLKNDRIAHNASIKVTYNKLNAAAVTSSVIIGTINGTTLARTGFKLLEKSRNLHLKEPKIIIAPATSVLSAVRIEMAYWALRFSGIYFADAPLGTTVPVAIAGRGPEGTVGFNFTDERGVLLFPWLKSFDPATNEDIDKPYAQFAAGVLANNDGVNGFHWSFSNKPIKSATGLAVEMTSSMVDDGSDAENLNKAGIVSIMQEGASGLKTYGNRSSAFPDSTKLGTFHSVRRTMDIAVRSIQLALRQYVDMPMIPAVRDACLETGNDYLRALHGREALLDGYLVYDPAKNPVSQIAQGKWVFSLSACPPPSFEDGLIESYIDVQMVSKLNENLV